VLGADGCRYRLRHHRKSADARRRRHAQRTAALGAVDARVAATEAGAIIMPPVPAFYARPKSIDDIVDHVVGRALDLFDLDAGVVSRWEGGEPRR